MSAATDNTRASYRMDHMIRLLDGEVYGPRAFAKALQYIADHTENSNSDILPTPQLCAQLLQVLQNKHPGESSALTIMTELCDTQYGEYFKERYQLQYGKHEWLGLMICLAALRMHKSPRHLIDRALKNESAGGLFINMKELKKFLKKHHKDRAEP